MKTLTCLVAGLLCLLAGCQGAYKQDMASLARQVRGSHASDCIDLKREAVKRFAKLSDPTSAEAEIYQELSWAIMFLSINTESSRNIALDHATNAIKLCGEKP